MSLNQSNDLNVKYDYEIPIIAELDVNKLTQSGGVTASETDGGYFS